MAKRGSYAKGAAKKEEILDTALRVIAENGYSKATLKDVADAVGLSQMGVLHHFGTKEELFTQVLAQRDRLSLGGQPLTENPLAEDLDEESLQRIIGETGEPIAAMIQGVARRNAETPGLIQLFTMLLAEGTEDTHKAHDYFQNRIARLHAMLKLSIERMQADGSLPESIDSSRLATLHIGLMDGLQTLSLYDDSVSVEEHLAFFWGLLGVGPSSLRNSGDLEK
jgi:AcrR family transcriptional regulator